MSGQVVAIVTTVISAGIAAVLLIWYRGYLRKQEGQRVETERLQAEARQAVAERDKVVSTHQAEGLNDDEAAALFSRRGEPPK